MDSIRYHSSNKCLFKAVIRTFLSRTVWICLLGEIIYNSFNGIYIFENAGFALLAAVIAAFLYNFLWCKNTVEIDETNILTISNALGYKKSFDLNKCKFDKHVIDFQIQHISLVKVYFLVLKTERKDKRIPCRYLSDEDFEALVAELVKRGAWAYSEAVRKPDAHTQENLLYAARAKKIIAAFDGTENSEKLDINTTDRTFNIERDAILKYFKKRNYKICFFIILGFLAVNGLCIIRDLILDRFEPTGYLILTVMIFVVAAVMLALNKAAFRINSEEYPLQISINPEYIDIDGRKFQNESITEAAIVIGRFGGATRLIIRTWTHNFVYWLGLPQQHKKCGHAFTELPQMYVVLSAVLGVRATYTDRRKSKEKTDAHTDLSAEYPEFEIPYKDIFKAVYRKSRIVTSILYTCLTALILFLSVTAIIDDCQRQGFEHIRSDIPIDILAYLAVMIPCCLPAFIIFRSIRRKIPKRIIIAQNGIQINGKFYPKGDIISVEFTEHKNKLYLKITENGKTKKYLMGNARRIKQKDFVYDEAGRIAEYCKTLYKHIPHSTNTLRSDLN